MTHRIELDQRRSICRVHPLLPHLGEALVVHDSEVFKADALAVEVHEGEHESLRLEGLDLFPLLQDAR
jgi:hypothetical protein